MVAAICVVLFALAAIAAAGSMLSAWLTYGAEIAALRAQYRAGGGAIDLSWRTAEQARDDASIYAFAIPMPVRARASRQDLGTGSDFRPSLAA